MIHAISSLSWLDFLYYTLIDRTRLAHLIDANKSFLPATIIITVLASFFEVVSFSLLSDQPPAFFAMLLLGGISLSLFSIAASLIQAGLISVGINLFSTQAKVLNIFTTLQLASIPKLFVLPAVAIFSSLTIAPAFFYAIFMLISYIISLIIVVSVVKELHKISLFESLIATVVPSFFVSALLGFGGLASILYLAKSFS